MIQYKRIGQICSVLNGFAFKSENYVDSGLRIIRIANVQKGAIEDSQPVYYPLSTPNMDKYLLHEGDLLLSLTGNVGRVAILGREFLPAALNQRVACLRITDTSVTIKYLFHILNSTKFENDCIQAANGVAQKNMSTEWLKQYEIPIYPVEIQENIVKELDKIQAVIQKRHKQISSFDDLVKSQFIEMFGDIKSNPNNFKVVSLQRLIDEGVITYHLDGNHGGEYPRNDEFIDSGVPYIGANCVVDGEVCLSNAKYLSLERAGRLKKGIAQTHDVLFAHNATVGPVAILVTDKPKVILSTSLTAFRRNRDKMNEMFLASFLRSDSFVSQYIPIMKQTTRNQFPVTAQRKCLFMVPPIDLQNEFARFVEQTDKSKFRIKQSLEKLEILYKALLQKYFG